MEEGDTYRVYKSVRLGSFTQLDEIERALVDAKGGLWRNWFR